MRLPPHKKVSFLVSPLKSATWKVNRKGVVSTPLIMSCLDELERLEPIDGTEGVAATPAAAAKSQNLCSRCSNIFGLILRRKLIDGLAARACKNAKQP
eukprot:3337448-Pleurochrysis_carterae.AAC.4